MRTAFEFWVYPYRLSIREKDRKVKSPLCLPDDFRKLPQKTARFSAEFAGFMQSRTCMLRDPVQEKEFPCSGQRGQKSTQIRFFAESVCFILISGSRLLLCRRNPACQQRAVIAGRP